MNYTVLARKYRPKKFADLIGQQTNITILKNIIKSKKLHHAYLLTGTRGIGKTTIARIISKALNCANLVNNDPCCSCDVCTQIDIGQFIDVVEIDAASNTGVDNIRDLIENASFTPISGKYKVYIIDEVHMLSKSAFNAMLKILEEPPQHVIFILATTDAHKIPITVLSRCLQLKLNPLMPQEISSYLAVILKLEQIPFENSALELIAKSANGSVRDALSLLDQVIAFSDNEVTEISVRKMLGLSEDVVIYQLLDLVIDLKTNELHKMTKNLHEQGYDLANILENLSMLLCDISLAQLTGNHENQNIVKYIDTISVNNVHLYFEICNLGLEQITNSQNKFAIFIMTILRMIAFKIGNLNAKEFTLSQDFYVSNNFITKNHSNNEADNAKTENDTIKNNKFDNNEINATNKIELNHNAIIFDGDWFKLINNMKPQLGYLYPFLENSKLINFHDKKFNILIDERYNAGFTSNTTMELDKIFTAYLQQNVNFIIQFTKNIDNTLKAKIQLDQKDKQIKAEDSINHDKNLSSILEALSAKIATVDVL